MIINDFRESKLYQLVDGITDNKKMSWFEKNNRISKNRISLTDMIDYGD